MIAMAVITDIGATTVISACLTPMIKTNPEHRLKRSFTPFVRAPAVCRALFQTPGMEQRTGSRSQGARASWDSGNKEAKTETFLDKVVSVKWARMGHFVLFGFVCF